MRPVTGATGRGSSARLVGFRPKGETKAAAPPTVRRPVLTPGAYGVPPWPLISPAIVTPLLVLHVQAVRPGVPWRALEPVRESCHR